MTSLQGWLSKPRATVRVDTAVPWAAWMKLLRRPFVARQADARPRIEVLDRLTLGGKKSLLLISIEGRRLLVGVGEDAAPSVSTFSDVRRVGRSHAAALRSRTSRGRRIVRA
jgi:flagellar biogenesis protein FliO